MIYISTGGRSKHTFIDTVHEYQAVGINAVELSGGLPCDHVEERLASLSSGCSLVLHNYFPPPRTPFVFNLASLNPDVARRSVAHAEYAIELSQAVGSRFYSFHAGFLIDPFVDELGRTIEIRRINDRREAMEAFLHRVNNLAGYAKARGVKLLIENNVLSPSNYATFGDNPLMMVELEETREIMGRSHENIGLLVDVAHLKVSALTLGFSAARYVETLAEETCAYHLSDNDGSRDSNDPIAPDSWFWPWIRKDLPYYSLEIYKQSVETLVEQRDLAKGLIG